MVLGSHVIFGAYGFWLPNDPRGSGSDFVGSRALLPFGRATRTSDPARADAPHDESLRRLAQGALHYPPVHFDGLQARAIGRGFAHAVHDRRLMVWACSILPEHVHMVIARHRLTVEHIVPLLKGAATRQLERERRHPMATSAPRACPRPQPWSRGEWKTFLNTVDEIARAIEYVQENPPKEGKPAQHWPFVTPFNPNVFPDWVRRRSRRT